MKPEDIINLGIDFASEKSRTIIESFRTESGKKLRIAIFQLDKALRAKKERKILSGSLEKIRGRLGYGKD